MSIFQPSLEVLVENSITQYRLMQANVPLSYAQVLNLWQTNPDFRSNFSSLLANSPFEAYRWETPALNNHNLDRLFEFVLINSPRFHCRPTDRRPFEAYFSASKPDDVVTFENLHGDATLIVPSPQTDNLAYGHLAAFIRHAPTEQVHTLWKVVGQMVCDRLNSSPIWLNTAGGGVAWLHVRLDSHPKYYRYMPYTQNS